SSLFKSWYAFLFLFVLLVVVASEASGLLAEHAHLVRFVSGWSSIACMLGAMGYVLRKYIHKLGLSFESRMAVDIEQLERAHRRLDQLRVLAQQGGTYDSAGAVRAAAKDILREEGVAHVL